MANTIKKQLFKDYLRERRDEHIKAVESNLYDDVYTIEEAKPSLEKEQIAFSIYQQYKVSKVIGGVKIGQAMFICNKDLSFVTYEYLHDEINQVIQEIDLPQVLQKLEDINTTMMNI